MLNSVMSRFSFYDLKFNKLVRFVLSRLIRFGLISFRGPKERLTNSRKRIV